MSLFSTLKITAASHTSIKVRRPAEDARFRWKLQKQIPETGVTAANGLLEVCSGVANELEAVYWKVEMSITAVELCQWKMGSVCCVCNKWKNTNAQGNNEEETQQQKQKITTAGKRRFKWTLKAHIKEHEDGEKATYRCFLNPNFCKHLYEWIHH